MRKECTLVLFDDDGNVIPNNITESPNDVIDSKSDVIESAEPSLKAIKKQIDEHWYLDKSDLINRADAICEVLVNDGIDNIVDRINALPTVDRPTVIRSRTLMPTKDFMEWAKRIKEANPNVIVIPCDAEVVDGKEE